MKVSSKNVDELIPYEFNNRIHSKQQINRIANSINEFGFNQPLVIDEANVVLVGHGRLLAAKKLGIQEVPVVVVTNLSEAQKKAYRILDNKLQNDSEWDFANLELELASISSSDFDLSKYGLDDLSQLFVKDEHSKESQYTRKVEAPIYEPKGDCPEISEVYNASFAEALIKEIEATNLNEDMKHFLICAAYRHVKINYSKVAELYCHQAPEAQRLFEKSALVIIDFESAIERGFVKLVKELTGYSEQDIDDEKQ